MIVQPAERSSRRQVPPPSHASQASVDPLMAQQLAAFSATQVSRPAEYTPVPPPVPAPPYSCEPPAAFTAPPYASVSPPEPFASISEAFAVAQPQYAQPTAPVPYAAPAAPEPAVQGMPLPEWLRANGFEAYQAGLAKEDISELSHFRDLNDEDVQQLADKLQMPIRTRRNFLVALEQLRQVTVAPPAYQMLDTKEEVPSSRISDLLSQEDFVSMLSLMKSYPKDEKLQQSAIKGLVTLARSDMVKLSLMEAEAYMPILDVLRLHTRSASLMESALGALWYIALSADVQDGDYCYRDYANDSDKVRLLAEGLPTLAIAAMRAHPSSLAVARYGCGMLWSLATVDVNKEALVQMFVHLAVTEAMRANPKDARTQVNGCGCIWSLTAAKNNLDELRSGGAQEAVSMAMQSLPKNKQVQNYGGKALRKLAT